jgi:hypothetical protein
MGNTDAAPLTRSSLTELARSNLMCLLPGRGLLMPPDKIPREPCSSFPT